MTSAPPSECMPHCIQCEYNLFGSHDSTRCPECGVTLDWDAIRARAGIPQPQIAFERASGLQKLPATVVTLFTVLCDPWLFARQSRQCISLKQAIAFAVLLVFSVHGGIFLLANIATAEGVFTSGVLYGLLWILILDALPLCTIALGGAMCGAIERRLPWGGAHSVREVSALALYVTTHLLLIAPIAPAVINWVEFFGLRIGPWFSALLTTVGWHAAAHPFGTLAFVHWLGVLAVIAWHRARDSRRIVRVLLTLLIAPALYALLCTFVIAPLAFAVMWLLFYFQPK